MSRPNPASHSPAEILELIQTQLLELRQTESLEAQIHEMVVSKRHRLDALMSEFLSIAHTLTTPAPQHIPLQPAMQAALQAAAHTPTPTPAYTPAPTPAPPPPAPAVTRVKPVEDLPLTQLPSFGAPKDLLARAPEPIQVQAPAPAPAPPAPAAAPIPTTAANPSAQQVLDSLNRLMSGLKEISGRQQ